MTCLWSYLKLHFVAIQKARHSPEPVSSHVTLRSFATLCPMCRLRKVDKLYHKTEEDFLLYMGAVGYHIVLKEVEKVRNCSFNLFGNSLFRLSDLNVFASTKNCWRKSKIIELVSAIVWNKLAIKLYMLAKGHWFPDYDLGNECA